MNNARSGKIAYRKVEKEYREEFINEIA